MKTYSHKKKEKLAARISQIYKKRDLVKIYEIIKNDDINKSSVTENNNGLFLFFHKLKYDTYMALEDYLNKLSNTSSTNSSEVLSDSVDSEDTPVKKEYNPYSVDDFPSQKDFSPKLKYSNREKNLIKRQRYDSNIIVENEVEQSDVFCNFDVSKLKEKN